MWICGIESWISSTFDFISDIYINIYIYIYKTMPLKWNSLLIDCYIFIRSRQMQSLRKGQRKDLLHKSHNTPVLYQTNNAPFCNRNVHDTCAHFCYKIVHCGIFVWCIVGYLRWVFPMKIQHQHDLFFPDGHQNQLIWGKKILVRRMCTIAQRRPMTWKHFPHYWPYVRRIHLPPRHFHAQGAVSIRKTVLPGMAIPMFKIRRPNGRLIFNMEITIRR